ncbi:MAG: penicillin-binding protein 2 [Akkermansiaceae bacterium]|nr:penicillin-binding protein 2 [Akkermansiaceae bacterium]
MSSFQVRCLILCSILMIGLSVLSARLIQIQLVDRQHYAESSRKAFHRVERLPAMRGMIVDRHEEPLAKSVPVSTLYVDKNHLNDPKVVSYGLAYQEASSEKAWDEMDDEARQRRIRSLRGEILSCYPPEEIVERHYNFAIGVLARPLGLRRDELRQRIDDSRGTWVPLVKDLPEDTAEDLRQVVAQNWIEGFAFQNSIKRWYTTPDRATHLLGHVGEIEERDEDGQPLYRVVGRSGIERTMEDYLTGRDGWQEHSRDARGLLVPGDESSLMPPRAGLNVQLTIDMGLQSIVEEELDAGLREFRAKKGAVVMLDPRSGEVLAMASRPHFNLNKRDKIVEHGYNYALQAVYEPGSTIKMVAAAGALDRGLVSLNTIIHCHWGHYEDGPVTVKDAYPKGDLSFVEVLKKSNNIGTYKMAKMLGQALFYDYLHGFGFGSKTGIALSGESAGMARNTGNPVDFSRASFGYATNVTPLQLASAYAAIASDGALRRPQVVKALVANDGTVVESFHSQTLRQVIKPRTAEQMRQALKSVTTEGGTATQAAVEGFEVAGKTGTARKYVPDVGYIEDEYVVSFVGMMPADNPAFVCLVVVDNPKPRDEEMKIYGGTIAAPIFSRIGTRAASYLNLEPTEPVTTDVAANP